MVDAWELNLDCATPFGKEAKDRLYIHPDGDRVVVYGNRANETKISVYLTKEDVDDLIVALTFWKGQVEDATV